MSRHEGSHRLGDSHALSGDGREGWRLPAECLAGALEGTSASGVRGMCRSLFRKSFERIVRLARSSPHVSQASASPFRTSIANMETVVSSAEKRGS